MRFNGIDPREISPMIFPSREIIQAIPPRTLRTLDTSNGPLYVGTDLQRREIKITMNFAGRSHQNANALAMELNRFFCTDEPGELEPTHMPGLAFTAILVSAGDLEWKWGFGTVDYVFAAMRPYIHSQAETVVSFIGSSRHIEPRGSVPILPVIKHTMSVAASQLALSLDAQQFFRLRPLSGTIAAGTSLAIDFGRRLVTMGGEPSMLLVDYTASSWHPEIKKGTLLSVSDAGATEVRWRDEWM